MRREEWGASVLTAALRRLRPRLAADLAFETTLASRGGDWWSVQVRCNVGDPAAVVDGRGTARLGRGWLPGDPRAGRRLQLALAQAVAQVAEGSGLGLGLWRRS